MTEITTLAAVLRRQGTPAEIEEIRLAPPKAGEVLVRILASGICHSDLHVRDGDWPRPCPLVLGHEGFGVIERAGPNVDQSRVGERVVMSWIAPCLLCEACQRGRPSLCTRSPSLRHLQQDGTSRLSLADGQEVLAYLGLGTLSERIVVPARAAVTLTSEIKPEVGALIGCCVATGYGAVVRAARVPAGARVVVLGLGGVGLSIVATAALVGAERIVAVDPVAGKLELARRMGATDNVLVADEVDLESRIVEAAAGPDQVFEASGQPSSVERALRIAGLGATVTLVGMPALDAAAAFNVYSLVERGVTVVGSHYGDTIPSIDFPRIATLYASGRLPLDLLVERRVNLLDLEESFDRLRRREVARQVAVFNRADAEPPERRGLQRQ